MKKYLLMLVAIATFALTSCGGDKKSDKDSDSKSKSEKVSKSDKSDVVDVEEAVEEAPTITPTGDVKADVKALADYYAESIVNPTGVTAQQVKATEKAFTDYYKNIGKEEEFTLESASAMLEVLSRPEVEKAMEDAMKKAGF